jgi:hypothetical protein
MISVFLIWFKDTIASMVPSANDISNSISYLGLSIQLDLDKVMLFLYTNCVLHIVIFIIILCIGLIYISSKVTNDK